VRTCALDGIKMPKISAENSANKLLLLLTFLQQSDIKAAQSRWAGEAVERVVLNVPNEARFSCLSSTCTVLIWTPQILFTKL
jgi:hypothetical protein